MGDFTRIPNIFEAKEEQKKIIAEGKFIIDEIATFFNAYRTKAEKKLEQLEQLDFQPTFTVSSNNVKKFFDFYRTLNKPKIESLQTQFPKKDVLDIQYAQFSDFNKDIPKAELDNMGDIEQDVLEDLMFLEHGSSELNRDFDMKRLQGTLFEFENPRYPAGAIGLQQRMLDLKSFQRMGKLKHLMTGTTAQEETLTEPFLTNFTLTLLQGEKENELPVVQGVRSLGEQYLINANEINNRKLEKTKADSLLNLQTQCLTAFFEIGSAVANQHVARMQIRETNDPALFKMVSQQTGEMIEEEDERKESSHAIKVVTEDDIKKSLSDHDKKLIDHISLLRNVIPQNTPEYKQKFLSSGMPDVFTLMNKCAESDIYNKLIEQRLLPPNINPQSDQYKKFSAEILTPFNGLISVFNDFQKEVYPAIHPVDIEFTDGLWKDTYEDDLFESVIEKKSSPLRIQNPSLSRELKDK